MAGLQRSSKPHPDCHATKEELLNKKKNPLDVDDDCPICERRGVLSEVGCHPSSASSAEQLQEEKRQLQEKENLLLRGRKRSPEEEIGIHENHRPLGFEFEWKILCDNIDSIWSSFASGFLECSTKQWYLIPVKRLYVRSCYYSNLQGFIQEKSELEKMGKTHIVAFIGTSGIGKSGFLQTLLVYLVHEAKSLGVIYSIRLKVFVSERSPPEDWSLLTDGHCSLYKKERVDYYLSDSVDIGVPDLPIVKIACVLATSEKSNESKQFEKLPGRVLVPMPVWTYDELLQISPFSNAENEIRYAAFGGSARNFLGTGSNLPVSESFGYVLDTMNWFFEEERTAKVLIEEKWQRICTYLEECLSSSNNKERNNTTIAVKALMWHTDNCREFFCASRFMALLAQHILSQHESSLKDALKAIVGASGVGFCFEYLGHKEMLRCGHRFKVKGKGQGNSGFIWEFPKLRLQKFRRAEDIPNLKVGSYGLPYRSNFPLIDAVIQPDTLINFTIAKFHKGANVEVENLRRYLLENDQKKHKFIWIVEDAENFPKQDGLGDIKQFAMCYADSRK